MGEIGADGLAYHSTFAPEVRNPGNRNMRRACVPGLKIVTPWHNIRLLVETFNAATRPYIRFHVIQQ